MVQLDLLRVHPEPVPERVLEPLRHVAQPDGPMPGVQQRPRHDPHRIGEVDDPGLRRDAPHPLGDVQHHRHRPQRLGQTPRPGRLLPHAPALQRKRLVAVPGPLPADPQLDQHRVGPLDRRLQAGARRHPAGMPQPAEDPRRQPADQLQALRGGRQVDQRQLLQRQPVVQPRETVGELGRVGGRAAHDDDLQPLTPVMVTPSMKARWARKNTTTTGAIAISVAAMVRFHSTACDDLNPASPTASVQCAGFSPV